MAIGVWISLFAYFALMIAIGMLCTIPLVVFARLAYGLVMPGMLDGLGLDVYN